MKVICWRAGALAAALILAAMPGGTAAKPITARDLATIADLQGLAVSPDGSRVAFQERRADPDAGDYSIVWKVASTAAGGEVRLVADGGDPYQPAIFGRVNGFIMQPAPVWSPDGKWIAYLKRESGRTHVWRAHVNGKRVEQVTKGTGDAVALAWSKDGKRILYKTELDVDEIAADLAEEGKSGFLFDRRFYPSFSPHPVRPKDVQLDELQSDEQKVTQRIFVYDTAPRTSRRANEDEIAELEALTTGPKIEDNEHIRGEVLYGPSGARAWTEARDPDMQGGLPPVTVMAKKDDATVVCKAEACTGQNVLLIAWRNDAEILFMRRDRTVIVNRVLYAWKPGAATVREVLRTENLIIDFEWKCAMGGARLICFYEENDHPRRLVAIDPADGSVETLYNPNPGFAAFDLGAKPERIDIRAEDGAETYGYLVLPPGYDKASAKPLPLVIVTYRCHGFLRGGVGDEYPIYPFAAAGFATLCINAPEVGHERLKTMDWGAYQNWLRGPGDPEKRGVQAGLEEAIAQLVKRGLVDRRRVAITGLSFGGEMTMYALFHMDLTAAAASGTEVGPSSTFLYSSTGRKQLGQWGLEDPMSDRWEALSIARNAGKVRGALLLNVSDSEMVAATGTFVALENAGRAVEMYVYPDEYHIKSQPAHRLSIYNRNIDWLNFWLRGVESGLTGDEEQYGRWRTMRESQCKVFGEGGEEHQNGDNPPWYCDGQEVKAALLQ